MSFISLKSLILNEQTVTIDEPTLKNNIQNFFNDNPNPSSKQFYDFLDTFAISDDNFEKIEAYVFELATIASQFLKGGRFNELGKKKEDFDPEQIKMGIEIEKEHSPNLEMAERIALDHLSEIPDYYNRLHDMEEM